MSWSKKYKDSIDCSNPKGFSQKAHCAGKKKKMKDEEYIPEEAPVASAPSTNTGSIPNPADTAMGPRVKEIPVHDRRRRKDKLPVLLKRFRKYIELDPDSLKSDNK